LDRASRDHGALEDADVVGCGKVLRYGLSPEVLQCSTLGVGGIKLLLKIPECCIGRVCALEGIDLPCKRLD
jgi:hypothetical protein